MKLLIHTLRISIAAIILFATTPAQAILITTDFSGEIYTAAAGNPFGVLAGDIVTGFTTYDDSLVATVGQSSVNIGSSVDFGLYLTIGSYTFDHTMDVEAPFGGTKPTVNFFDGQLSGFDFVTLPGFNGSLYNLEIFIGTAFTVRDTDNTLVTGEITSLKTTQVPEPSAILLLGLGLVSLLIVKNYRNTVS